MMAQVKAPVTPSSQTPATKTTPEASPVLHERVAVLAESCRDVAPVEVESLAIPKIGQHQRGGNGKERSVGEGGKGRHFR